MASRKKKNGESYPHGVLIIFVVGSTGIGTVRHRLFVDDGSIKPEAVRFSVGSTWRIQPHIKEATSEKW